VRALVLADTHIPGFAEALPDALRPELERCDVVLHAGDVDAAPLLGELASFAPVHVALGNNDRDDVRAWGALEEVHLELGGIAVAMVHDSGPRQGRERRLRRRFPDARVIVFGHSHIPLAYEDDGVLFVNPGSPTWKRRQPRPTYAVLTIGARGRRSRILKITPL
jgi:putative phosphoesterase